MGERLADGNVGIALLANTGATGAMLFVLITIFGPISGAHFNPAVSAVAALQRNMTWIALRRVHRRANRRALWPALPQRMRCSSCRSHRYR